MRDFLVSHADVPVGARLWTFGTPVHVDSDGWTAERGKLVAGEGFATLTPDRGEVTLLSPADQVIRPSRIASLLVRFEGAAKPAKISVEARDAPASPWRAVGTTTTDALALAWPAAWRRDATIVTRLRLSLHFAPGGDAATLSRVLLYPRAPIARASPKTK
jgi:hypothetical protein